MSIVATFIVPHPPIILPEIGGGRETEVQKTIDSYCEIAEKIAEIRPETIIITSPHSIMYSDYFHISPGDEASGDMRKFGASGMCVKVPYDKAFVQTLEKNARFQDLSAGTLGEKDASLDHGTFIPLHFITQRYTNFKAVRIGISGLPLSDHYAFGQQIAHSADQLDCKTVFIASGDLSHKVQADGPYGLTPEGLQFDRQITCAMAEADFATFLSFTPDVCEKAAECGLRSFIIMAGALDGKSVRSRLLSYEGTFGVGYAVAEYIVDGDDPKRHFLKKYEKNLQTRIKTLRASEDAYLSLARLSLETYVRTSKHIEVPANLPPEMLVRQSGVFVSIKKEGSLRGCIGTIHPVTDNIANEIIRNAVSSGTQDPRFSPVSINELDRLVYDVDVLYPPEDITSSSQLDVRQYGLIVSSGHKRGLLLPNLDGVESVEQQIEIASRKAGIHPGEKISLQRFKVERHE